MLVIIMHSHTFFSPLMYINQNRQESALSNWSLFFICTNQYFLIQTIFSFLVQIFNCHVHFLLKSSNQIIIVKKIEICSCCYVYKFHVLVDLFLLYGTRENHHCASTRSGLKSPWHGSKSPAIFYQFDNSCTEMVN